MKTFINIIQCCSQEEIKKGENIYEYQIPIYNENENTKPQEIQSFQEKKEHLIIDSSYIKANENNNTMNTLNNTFNTNYNIISECVQNINNNLNTKLNNINIDKNNNNEIKSNNIKIKKESFSPSKKRIIYSNSISHNYFNINKAINNNLGNKNNRGSVISKSNASKNNMSNYGSILTLNNLILTTQFPEEKNNTTIEIGSKLLLSGELFFWKDVIISTNGLKNSLRKEKDDHVFFGVKNISNNSGEPFNDLITNFFYQEEDSNLIETSTGRIFEIFYNKKIKEYILRFLHPNLILYSKINNFVYFAIGKFYFFLLGNVFISVNIKKNTPIEKIINIQVELENNKPLKYSFSQNQTPIKIGRSNCDISIFNSSISKNHGIIEYSKNSQTFYYNDLGSTNGSTLIIKEGDTLKIKGEMNFKLEDVPFKIQEIP